MAPEQAQELARDWKWMAQSYADAGMLRESQRAERESMVADVFHFAVTDAAGQAVTRRTLAVAALCWMMAPSVGNATPSNPMGHVEWNGPAPDDPTLPYPMDLVNVLNELTGVVANQANEDPQELVDGLLKVRADLLALKPTPGDQVSIYWVETQTNTDLCEQYPKGTALYYAYAQASS